MAGAVLAVALSGSCSFAFDPDQAQCTRDEDCLRRGAAFAGSVCLDSVCQPVSQTCTPGVDCEGSQNTGTSGTGSHTTVGGSGLDAGGTGVDVPGTTGGTNCVGEGCAQEPPQCQDDADCEARGVAGGRCVDQTCWAPEPECVEDTDCAARGPEYVGGRCLESQCRPNPRWRCERPVIPADTGTVTLRVLVRHSISLDPLVNVRASACQKLDLQCADPVVTATTGSDGYLVMEVPFDFAGYLQVEERNFFPALYFLPPALPADGELQPFPLMPSGIIVDALATIGLGTGLDPSRGHMMLVAEDCFGEALPGVVFESPMEDASTVQFYVRDLLPSTSATETGEVGNGGYLNFPAGSALIDVTSADDGLKLTSFTVVVRPGFISVAYVRPQFR